VIGRRYEQQCHNYCEQIEPLQLLDKWPKPYLGTLYLTHSNRVA